MKDEAIQAARKQADRLAPVGAATSEADVRHGVARPPLAMACPLWSPLIAPRLAEQPDSPTGISPATAERSVVGEMPFAA